MTQRLKTDKLLRPPCDCKGKDCLITTKIKGNQYSRYQVHTCEIHGTHIIEEPVSIKIVTTFADGTVDTAELRIEDPRV